MEKLILSEKNKIHNKIKEVNNFIEKDNNTINRLKYLQINLDFNKKQIEKLILKNNEREKLIISLNQRMEDLLNGKLLEELQEKTNENKKILEKKAETAVRKKEEINAIKNANKNKSKIYWEKTLSEERNVKRKKYEMKKKQDFFFNSCFSIPEYMSSKLENMPNNKGYIWKDIYLFGKLPPDKNQKKIVLFEKKYDKLFIHEWYENYFDKWEKSNNGKRVLISRKYKETK